MYSLWGNYSMIEIKIFNNDEKFEIEVIGHSGYAEIGKDIVCSAVSILSYTLLQVVSEYNFQEGDYNMLEVDHKMEAGYFYLKLRYINLTDLKAAVNTIITGYRLVENTYPQNVSLRNMTNGDTV